MPPERTKGRNGLAADPALVCHTRYVRDVLVKEHPLAVDGLPVLGQDRPESLIETLAVFLEGLPEKTFLHGADLLQSAVAAAVLNDSASFQPMNADFLKCELHHQFGSSMKYAGSPVRRSDCKSPFRDAEPGLERAELNRGASGQNAGRITPFGLNMMTTRCLRFA
jgi:hypothetical protein